MNEPELERMVRLERAMFELVGEAHAPAMRARIRRGLEDPGRGLAAAAALLLVAATVLWGLAGQGPQPAALGGDWRVDRGEWVVRDGTVFCRTSVGYATKETGSADATVSATVTGPSAGLLAAASLENGLILDGVQARLLDGRIQVWEWADGASNLGRRDLAFAAAPAVSSPGGDLLRLTVSGRTASVSLNGAPALTVKLSREPRGTRVGMSLGPSPAGGGTWRDFKVTR